EGECGACSVLINGEVVNSCLIAAGQVEGCNVTTVEGLATNGALSLLQRAFIDHGAAQCGICTPGMLLAAHVLLQRTRRQNADDVREALAGLKGVHRTADSIEIGAAESYTGIIRSTAAQEFLPALVAAARTIGAAQIQNRGTLGGNLANASPAGDTLPVLLAYDATVVTD